MKLGFEQQRNKYFVVQIDEEPEDDPPSTTGNG
jgi:hypothetical protein